MGSKYPIGLAWFLSGCCSVLMVFVCVCRGVVSIRTVGLKPCSSLCVLSVGSVTVAVYGYQTRYQSRTVECSCVLRHNPRVWEVL